MAPKEKESLTAAERQRRRREKLKREGGYEEYKAKHARTVQKYRMKQAELLKSFTEEKKAQVIKQRRKKDCLRKQKSRRKQAQVSQQPSTSGSQQPYKRRSSLSRAVNSVKKVLPSSPTKRKAVVRRLSEELDDTDSTPSNPQRLSTLPTETRDAVKSFYERDDISRISPGKRDVITVRGPNGEKEKPQKRHLYLNIKETYGIFQEENPNVKIGSSKFAELRPQNVLLSSQTPSNVCTCIYHQNLFLALHAIHTHAPRIPTYSTNFPASCLRDPESDLCWFGKCCHDDCGFAAVYSLPDDVKDLDTKWFRWQKVNGRLSKLEERGKLEDLYDYISSITPKFMQHCRIKRRQAQQYELDKQIATAEYSKTAVLQMDFAENYSCAAQDEVQSAHWNQSQVTLFTTVTWFRQTVSSKVIVSDFMDHSKAAVVPFLDEILKGLPPEADALRIWTDGPSSQFKNRYVIGSMKMLSERHGIRLFWNFSATSHGKGPVDGIGGSLKRIATEKVRSRQVTINNAIDFFKAVQGTRIATTLMRSEHVQDRAISLGLAELFADAKAIKGISEQHWFGVGDKGKILTKRHSSEA